MIIEFNNGKQLEVISIFGGPVYVDGVTRDVLTIDIDTDTITLNELRDVFGDTSYMSHIYTYEEDYDEEGKPIDVKIEIGEGYTILLDIKEVTRKVERFPGKILPDEYETVYSVDIAQMTYDEWIESGLE